MEQLIELLQQIQELAGAGVDALKGAAKDAGGGDGGGKPPMHEGGGGEPPAKPEGGGGEPPAKPDENQKY